jgi:hypothetical protein
MAKEMIWIPLSQFNTLMRLSGDADITQTESQIQRLLTDPTMTYEERSRRYGPLLNKSIRQRKEVEEKPARVIVENLPQIVPTEPPVEEPPEAVPLQPEAPPSPPKTPKKRVELTPMMQETLNYVLQNASAFSILPNKQIKNVNGKPIQHSSIDKIIRHLHKPDSDVAPAGFNRFLLHAKKDPHLATLVGGQSGGGSIKVQLGRGRRLKCEKWTFF